MDFNNTLFSMPLLVGIIFIITGLIMYKFPPKKINMLYGYRTSASMKNQVKWNFAQKYASLLMIYCGIGLSISSVLGLLFKLNEVKGVFISLILIIITVLILIYKIESSIKQKFKDGE